MTELSFTIDVPTDGETSPETLQTFLTELRQLATKHGVTTTFSSVTDAVSDWDWNEPCPICGSEEFTVKDVEYNMYILRGENFEFESKDGHGNEPYLEVFCRNTDCETVLHQSPAGHLLGP